MMIRTILLVAAILAFNTMALPCLAQEKSVAQIIEEALDELNPYPNAALEDLDQKPSPQVNQELNAQYELNNPDGSGSSYSDIPDSDVIDVLELKDVEITDVLKLLSQKTKLNIIANQGVRGKVTIFLKDVKLKDALAIILDSNNLAYKVEESIIRIMPAREFEERYGYKFGGNVKNLTVHLNYANVNDLAAILLQIKSQTGQIVADVKSNTLIIIDSSEKIKIMQGLIKKIDVPVQTEVFDLVYAEAKTVNEKLAEVINKDTGRIRFDERSNKIVVTDTPSKINEIRKLIKAFDVKEPQVLIEAKIIQVTLDKSTQYGVDWEAIVQRNHQLNFKSDFNVIPATATNSGTVRIGTLDTDSYTALIQALQTTQHTTILSSPSITTLNNREAKILVGTTQPYVTSTTTTPSSGPSTTAESINFIDIGVKLYVTPTIHHDRFITMKIRPEVSSAGTSITTSNGNKIPVVDTSQAETNVVVKDGITIVIGGLIKDQTVEASSRIPVLSKIPVIGAAFRNQDIHPVKSEIIIFLTPRIITGDVPAKVEPRPIKMDDLEEGKLLK